MPFSQRGGFVNGNRQEEIGHSGLYVDMENFQAEGQSMVQNLIENWPDKVPAATRLTLYVRADQSELWRLWATSQFASMEVVVHGTQHFSMSATKNSADISIATSAMADLLLKRVSHVVVFSDDSDFISLYTAIRNELGISPDDGKAPFLWVVTDRDGSLSATVRQFFPRELLHVVEAGSKQKKNRQASKASPERTSEARLSPIKGSWTEMADAVISDIPVGPFKSTECLPIIKNHWPDHTLAKAGGAEFGSQFKNNIWPILEKRGVKIENPGKKPIKYDMTAGAKNTV